MAKISARGATEVARIRTRTVGGHEMLWVMASDGRVLRRFTGDAGTSYTVYRRNVRDGNRNAAGLIEMARQQGHEIVA